MKRFGFLLFASLLVPATAIAGWVSVPLPWQSSHQGTPFDPTGIAVVDTTHNVLAAGTIDTSWTFSASKAMPIPRGLVGSSATGVNNSQSASGSDTAVVFFLVLQCDSTLAPTAPTLSLATVFIDGRAGGLGPATSLARGWVKCDSTIVVPIAGAESVAIPFKSIGPYTAANLNAFDNLRARISTTTGVMSGSVRLFLRYWVP